MPLKPHPTDPDKMVYVSRQYDLPDATMQSLKDLKRTVCDEVGKAAFAQPQQMPVAWGVFEGNLHDMFFTEAEAIEMAYLKGTQAVVKPLYESPPQRTWVGLTKEEIAEFDTWHDNREEEAGWCNPSEIVAYIEAKLRSKNNG